MNAYKAKKYYALIAALFMFSVLASGCGEHSADWDNTLPSTMTKASVPTVSYVEYDDTANTPISLPERETTKRTAYSETEPPLATVTGTTVSDDEDTEYSVISGLPKVPISEFTSSTPMSITEPTDPGNSENPGSSLSSEQDPEETDDAARENTLLESSSFRPYGYKYLSEKQLYVYDAIISAAEQHKDSINISSVMDITVDDYKNVYEIIYNDEPSLFYVSQTMRYTKNTSTGKLSSATLLYKYSRTETEKMQHEIDSEADKILGRITPSMNDYDKVKLFYDELASSVTYDDSARNCHDIYGVFVDRKAICGGFSKAFSYLCDKAGVENLTITGDAEGTPHMWNMVKLDGRWYHIDVTYAAGMLNGEHYVRYGYFCVPDEMLEDCRSVYDQSYEYPQAPDNSLNYFARNGLVAENMSDVKRIIHDGIVRASRDKEPVVQFKCADRELYEEAVSELQDQKEAIFKDAILDSANRISTVEYRPDKTPMVFYIFIEYAQ